MTFAEALSIISPIISALVAFVAASKKLVTSEDIKGLIKKVEAIDERTIVLEKQVSLLEYRVNEIEREG